MRKSIIALAWMLLFLSTGCVETLVMDPGETEPPVVVTCVIRIGRLNRRHQTVNLQYAKRKSEAEFVPVEEAEVYMVAHKQVIEQIIPFVRTGDGLWEADSDFFQADTEYTLHVDVPGRDHIQAETRTPPIVGMDYSHDETMGHVITLSASEGCALWVTAYEYTEDNPGTPSRLDYIVTDHPYADGMNRAGIKFSDLSFLGSSVTVEQKMVQASYARAQEHMPDCPVYDGFLRIGNLGDFKDPFFICAGPLHTPDHKTIAVTNGFFPACSFLQYSVVSKEYDRYLRSAYILNESTDTYLTTVYSGADAIYSNINGGLGIFGACWDNATYFLYQY